MRIVIPRRHRRARVVREILPRLHRLHPPDGIVGVFHRIRPRAGRLLEFARREELIRHARGIRQRRLPHAPHRVVSAAGRLGCRAGGSKLQTFLIDYYLNNVLTRSGATSIKH